MKKRRNKLVTLGMAAMMTAALMSGCGKKATPENLLKDMAKNMKDTESVVANMKMDMEMGDDTTTIGIQMDMDIDMDLKSGESHAKGAVDMKMMGTNVGILCIRWRTISGKKKRWMILRQIWRENFRILQEVWEDTQNLLRCPKKRWK